MKTFLQEVAQDLYTHCGDSLHRYRLMFPSRRAQLFFFEALSELTDKPVWQPQTTTIDEWMCRIAGLEIGDRLRLLTELYKVYRAYHLQRNEHCDEFDKFYTWGGVLLTDFDMVDKYRIDAEQLFRNIEDLKELEADLSYLTPHQLEVLRRFWEKVRNEQDLTATKRKFLGLWQSLLPIYKAFREQLTRLGFGYGGMVHRRAAERLEEGLFTLSEPHFFVVAGFNALTACERQLFRFLQANATTRFYWDYDNYYKADEGQEAGRFMRQNLIDFPAAASVTNNAMRGPKRFTSVAASSNVIQCKYVGDLLAKLNCVDKDTAVVLTDEKMLTPMLYALPERMDVNVTMGYPMQQTPAYTLVERLLSLQANRRMKEDVPHFYHADVTGLLSHPYLLEYDAATANALRKEIVENYYVTLSAEQLAKNPLLTLIARAATTWQMQAEWMKEVVVELMGRSERMSQEVLRTEYLRILVEELHKLSNSLSECDVELTCDVYASLVRRHLQSLRIPYKGEPLRGVQVMGILETRSLDFKNVILLSMTDDNFPGTDHSQSSFIPPVLRQGFDLPTPEHHEGVYAYYFYRLIQRAEQVWMVYCSRADDKSTGEPSRYIRQIDFESPFKLQKEQVGVDVRLDEPQPIVIEKDEAIMAKLNRYIDPEDDSHCLSPSSLMPFLTCPLQFYFKKVAGLREDDELEELVDNRIFGLIFHKAAEALYASLKGVLHPKEQLGRMLNDEKLLIRTLDEAIAEVHLHRTGVSVEEYSGDLLLVRNILLRYLKQTLAYDATHPDFYVVNCEEEISYDFPFEVCGEERKLHFKGFIDRFDKLDEGCWRILDYKTGKEHRTFSQVEDLFRSEKMKDVRYITQTMLYSMMLSHKTGIDVRPALYFVRYLGNENATTYLECSGRSNPLRGIHPYSVYADDFEAILRSKLTELFDPGVPFRQCEDEQTCLYCDFKTLCRRYPIDPVK